MVHSSCHVVGTITSLFRRYYHRRHGYKPIQRCDAEEEEETEKVQGGVLFEFRRYYNRRRGYKPIPRCDVGEEDAAEKAQDGSKSVLCEGCKKVILKCEEELDGEGPEGCGDRLMARCRLRSRSETSFAGWKDLADASYMYTRAGSWRKAVQAYGELAAYSLRRGSERSTLLQRRSELSAGSALLRSAKCYGEIEEKREEDVAAMKLALEEALALFVKHGDQRLAATACSDLAEFHLDRNDLQDALLFYERAAEYYGTAANRRSNRFCRFRAQLVTYLLANQEALHANGALPIHDYKRKCVGYMKPSDPDWLLLLGQMLGTSSVAHDYQPF
ncbi:hypothetical protein CFC21_021598 [Triticum aestivum]|uniref:Uncharacterized protein n=2 Tax=Triticum aestivum TaxID=4565 RepID=A0A3B6C2C3_WHEAT|nr:uncharacterized protein LOC123040537 [Triticum aestivum]KAF7006562.1 hypothetical protein CFC21_021598 [Triticum aestivum]